MISPDYKANAEQRGNSSEEIAPVGKAIWHCPALWRLETMPATRSGPADDGMDAEDTGSLI